MKNLFKSLLSYKSIFIKYLSTHLKIIESKSIHTTNNKARVSSGFSMMELLFVIVILGILASIALPRINFSRNNALSVAIQSDIQIIISSTQEYAITNEFLPQNATVQWLISYLHLSPQRWVISGDMLKIGKNGVLDSNNDCVSIKFDGIDYLQIVFNRNANSNLCKSILKNYANDIFIPLDVAF